MREWLEVQDYRSILPAPDQLLVETFPHEHRHYMVAYSFEGWNAHQSLGMLITRRMESAGLKPLGFVSNDYALACYGLEPITDPAPLFSADMLEHEFVDWVQSSNLLKRAFREVAVIGGLVERHHPGKRKIGAAGQLLDRPHLRRAAPLRARPPAAARPPGTTRARRLTDVGRLARLLDRAQGTMVHVDARPGLADGGAGAGHHRPRAHRHRHGRRQPADRGGKPRRARDAGGLAIAPPFGTEDVFVPPLPDNPHNQSGSPVPGQDARL